MPDDSVTLPGFENLRGVELVQRLPLFRTLSFEETRRLFAIATPRRMYKGEVLIEERSVGEALHIVQAGTLRVTRGGTFLGCVGPGELLGEMSLVDDVLTSGRVAADTECEVLSIPRSAFDVLMERDPPLAIKVYKAFCRTLADRLRRANNHVPVEEALRHGVF